MLFLFFSVIENDNSEHDSNRSEGRHQETLWRVCFKFDFIMDPYVTQDLKCYSYLSK